MEAPGEKSDAVVQTVDIFPTLCELAGVPKPNFAHGTSLTPQLKDPDAPGHNAYSYSGKAKTIRTPSHRMTLHPNGSIELYDHRSPEKETSNIADQNSAQCEQLKELIIEKEKMQQSSL